MCACVFVYIMNSIIATNLFCLVHALFVIGDNCEKRLSNELKYEIRSYEPIIELIKRTIIDFDGPFKNATYTRLANFVDDFGSRISGSQNLEDAIDFLLHEFHRFQFDNAHAESVSVPHWIRNNESAELVKPRKMKLAILGLGGSVATPEDGIKAPAVVVRSFDELKNRSLEVAGKIVVFNEEYVNYGETVAYRSRGASEASRLGAVAVLIRSITPFSIGSPHTGSQHYDADVKSIPTACISIEHAEMLHRLYTRGISLEINLKMAAQQLPNAVSRNLIGEIKGKFEPDKIVLVSGHIDSWDVGQGAMDDGGGAFISWLSIALLKHLKLRPRRTIRTVLWTAEEQGYWGARSYVKEHSAEIRNFTLVMESDMGTFSPTGLKFYGSKRAYCIMNEIMKLMKPFNSSTLEVSKYPVESDISLFQQYGVPGAGLRNENEKYFYFHHSDGDSMAVEDVKSLDLCTALFAAVSYVVANISEDLPKELFLMR